MAARCSLFRLAAAVAALTLSAGAATALERAQDRAQERLLAPVPPPGPPKELARPKVRTDLDKLFDLLRKAPDKQSGKLIEARIWSEWFHTKSDTAALLMARVKAAMEADDNDTALQLLDAVVEILPDYVEGWDRRATLNLQRKDYGAALYDLAQTLAREPRHFGAMVALGMILQEIGQEKRALAAFRQALALNPHLDRVPDLIKQLAPKVEGRNI